MELKVSIPAKAQIINGGFEINIAADGESWSKSQLGDYAGKSGVYILHSNGRIIYIGKTTEGEYGKYLIIMKMNLMKYSLMPKK